MEKVKDLIRPFVPGFVKKRRIRKLIEKLAAHKGLDYSGIDLSDVPQMQETYSKSPFQST